MYQINADIVDLRQYVPQPSDTFLLDTNVWVWLAYTKASVASPPRYQARQYPSFAHRAIKAGAKLFHCGLSLSELSNVIEREEFHQFAASSGTAETPYERKNFRRISTERAKVTQEISAAWSQVSTLSGLLAVSIDQSATNACLKTLCASVIDPYDGFLVEAALAGGVLHIVSDDTDLCSVGGVRIYTANNRIIASAKAAGRLLS